MRKYLPGDDFVADMLGMRDEEKKKFIESQKQGRDERLGGVKQRMTAKQAFQQSFSHGSTASQKMMQSQFQAEQHAAASGQHRGEDYGEVEVTEVRRTKRSEYMPDGAWRAEQARAAERAREEDGMEF